MDLGQRCSGFSCLLYTICLSPQNGYLQHQLLQYRTKSLSTQIPRILMFQFFQINVEIITQFRFDQTRHSS